MFRSFALLAMAALVVTGATGCINPNLVNSSLGGLYPTAPGDTRFLLVRVVNETTATLDIPVVFDDGTNAPPILIADLTPGGREAGVLLNWPVVRLGVGDLDNPLAPTIIASFDDGTSLAIPPQIPALVAGQNYDQGDVVIFQFTSDSRTPAGITVSVGRIDGSTQEGPFSRADTFEMVQLLLLRNQLEGGTTVP